MIIANNVGQIRNDSLHNLSNTHKIITTSLVKTRSATIIVTDARNGYSDSYHVEVQDAIEVYGSNLQYVTSKKSVEMELVSQFKLKIAKMKFSKISSLTHHTNGVLTKICEKGKCGFNAIGRDFYDMETI